MIPTYCGEDSEPGLCHINPCVVFTKGLSPFTHPEAAYGALRVLTTPYLRLRTADIGSVSCLRRRVYKLEHAQLILNKNTVSMKNKKRESYLTGLRIQTIFASLTLILCSIVKKKHPLAGSLGDGPVQPY